MRLISFFLFLFVSWAVRAERNYILFDKIDSLNYSLKLFHNGNYFLIAYPSHDNHIIIPVSVGNYYSKASKLILIDTQFKYRFQFLDEGEKLTLLTGFWSMRGKNFILEYDEAVDFDDYPFLFSNRLACPLPDLLLKEKVSLELGTYRSNKDYVGGQTAFRYTLKILSKNKLELQCNAKKLFVGKYEIKGRQISINIDEIGGNIYGEVINEYEVRFHPFPLVGNVTFSRYD